MLAELRAKEQMIPRRVYEHVKAHNWFAVAIDFVIVVGGVFMGVQVSNWNEARAEQRRTALVVEALRQDLRDSVVVEERFLAEVGAGLNAFDEARARRKAGALLLPHYRLRHASEFSLAGCDAVAPR